MLSFPGIMLSKMVIEGPRLVFLFENKQEKKRKEKRNRLRAQSVSYFIYFSFTDLDPCINVSCNYFAVCKAFGPRDARCICVDNCPSYEEPVCSSNGTTYDNECVFQREMCHLKANFTLYHPGDCTGNGVSLLLIELQMTTNTIIYKDETG